MRDITHTMTNIQLRQQEQPEQQEQPTRTAHPPPLPPPPQDPYNLKAPLEWLDKLIAQHLREIEQQGD